VSVEGTKNKYFYCI